MSDEKPRQFSDGASTKGDGIPVPVTNVRDQPRSNSKSRLRRMLLVSAVFLVGYISTNGLPGFMPHYAGYTPHHKHHHKHGRHLVGKAAEKAFLEVPDEKSCIKTSFEYTKKPHRAGSEGDLDTAKEFLAHLQNEIPMSVPDEVPIYSAGSPESRDAILSIPKTRKPKAWIDIYYPVMNTPLDRNLQALDDDGKVIWEADLTEHADDTDSAAGKYADAVPTFHGLSRGGDVSGKLIYANYGLKEVKGAQEVGAAGVLIYSDYRDDGAVTAENGYEIYPNGPARHPTSVQRGSVQFLSMYPGDPTTPGYPSYENSTRTEGENIPKIPSLPISAENAGKLMELLEDEEWNGVVRLNNQG
ncbi:transferrin receptor ectodomain, apical domain-containing protein [Dendrothele bispora CBS 962.96]|uniref:Transferrin receptor ectodomain, apical domain-containing protein n=1 Tax=Dendrothele bispora (strain CBS 962.96) TaxID=1314807 RepID=A0A4S8KTR4_DENBC|nr:transferrin receptor ectodomain, apical domain-containing protein [Dendrothele bispora CBS 962.96]